MHQFIKKLAKDKVINTRTISYFGKESKYSRAMELIATSQSDDCQLVTKTNFCINACS